MFVVDFAHRSIMYSRIINTLKSVFKSQIMFSNHKSSFQITNQVIKSQMKYKISLFSNHLRQIHLWRTPRRQEYATIAGDMTEPHCQVSGCTVWLCSTAEIRWNGLKWGILSTAFVCFYVPWLTRSSYNSYGLHYSAFSAHTISCELIKVMFSTHQL